jgi:hypothetical protein
MEAKFSKSEHSTFKYWFAHWCAYNMTALVLHAWHPRYLLHDIEKPWMKFFMPYTVMKEKHRSHSRHHYQYRGGVTGIDYEGMIIDWESAKLTKADSQMNAREYFEANKQRFRWVFGIEKSVYFIKHVEYAFERLGL